MAEPELPKIIGRNAVYDLRGLLLGQPGDNVRNLMAHGLLGDSELNNPRGIYLWWLILRMLATGTTAFRDFAKSLGAGESPNHTPPPT